jgi:H+/Cl- antiporter ClcA
MNKVTPYWRRVMTACLASGLIGVGLGMMMAIITVARLSPVNLMVSTMAFQNFAMVTGALTGFLAGVVAMALYMVFTKRATFKNRMNLAMVLGGIAGLVLFMATFYVLNTYATTYQMIPSSGAAFIADSIIIAVAGITAGALVGLAMVNMGKHPLDY